MDTPPRRSGVPPSMSRADVARVIARVPGLNAHGIGPWLAGLPWTRASLQAVPRPDVEALIGDEAACTRACAWMASECRPRPIGRRSLTSYEWKHRAEREIGHVTNGAFIAAAIHMGFSHRIVPGSPNVLLGIGAPRRRDGRA